MKDNKEKEKESNKKWVNIEKRAVQLHKIFNALYLNIMYIHCIVRFEQKNVVCQCIEM